VTLTVTDDGGKTDQITHQVTVVDAPASAPPTSAPVDSNGLTTSVTDAVRVDESPTAALAFAPALPTTGQAVSFDATGADPDGSVADYRWQFGDGGSATGAAPTHTYKTAGTYTVRVGVTDSDGQSATVGRTVTVGAARLARVTVRVGSTREAAIRVTVNAPGTIHGVGKPRPFRAPGTQTLKLRLTRAELRRLNHRARLTVQVTIKFVPVAGPISSRKVTIRFRR
jgi:PKD repeat protein